MIKYQDKIYFFFSIESSIFNLHSLKSIKTSLQETFCNVFDFDF